MTLVHRRQRESIPMRSALERFFGDWPLLAMSEGYTEMAPPLDLRETDDAYEVEIELPGVKPEDTEVLIEGRILTVRGQFAEEQEHTNGQYIVRERRRGQFMRAVALPGIVDVDKVSTGYENGELIITLPKAAQNRARRIQIKASGNGKSTGQLKSGSQSPGSQITKPQTAQSHGTPASGSQSTTAGQWKTGSGTSSQR